MRLRKLTAAALAVLAVTGLTACKSKAGVAAVIDGHRISETDLSDYVTRTGPDPTAAQQAAAQGGRLLPKTIALNYLVQEQVFRRVLAKSGGVPDKGTLASSHDSAAAMLLNTTLTGKALDDAIGKEAKRDGLKGEFVTLYLRTIELEKALIERVNAGTPTELIAAVGKARVGVSVNPRYGKWNAQRITLDNPNSTVPSFVKLSTAPQAPAA